jgi:dihydrofolate synthase/folylpolyglutamate synthase
MSTYTQTIRELYDLQKFAIKLGLDNVRALSGYLGDPQLAYPVIHVAGTNGKGSTAYFIARILNSMGLKTGLYTSPHLVDFRERIRVGDQLIEESYMTDFWADIRDLVYSRKATFFDVTTALALDYFRHKKVDVAIVETGLGGRLDSTNIVSPSLIVITPIRFDHEKQLGRNLTSIATEKAGIFKNNCLIFSARQHPAARAALVNRVPGKSRIVFLDEVVRVKSMKADLDGTWFSLSDRMFSMRYDSLFCRQPGDFQLGNLALAYISAREFLKRKSIPFRDQCFKKALSEQQWPGRLQTVSLNPRIICDVSHNYHGIRKTVSFIESQVKRENRILLIGLVKDKNYGKITRFLNGRFREIYITEPETERRLDGTLIKRSFGRLKQDSVFIKDLKKAYELAKTQSMPADTLLIIGSHYLIGAYLADSN